MDKSIWTSKSMNAIVKKSNKLANCVSPKKQSSSSQNSPTDNCTFHCLTLKKSNEKPKSWSKTASMSKPKSANSSSDNSKTLLKSNRHSRIPCKLEELPNPLSKKDPKSNSLMGKEWNSSHKLENSKWKSSVQALQNSNKFKLRFSKILASISSMIWYCRTKNSLWLEKSMIAFWCMRWKRWKTRTLRSLNLSRQDLSTTLWTKIQHFRTGH